MKKVYLRIVLFVLIVSCCFLSGCIPSCFSGCSSSDEDAEKNIVYNEVSSLEELLKGGNMKLTCDIDCEYETIEGISSAHFDGQGYTIKNCVITCSTYNGTPSFFKRGASSIKNVTLENITVKSTNTLSTAIVINADCDLIENVHVKDSKLSGGQAVYGSGLGKSVQDCYIDVIYGGYYPSSKNNSPTKDFSCDINNCSVENTNIEVNGYKSSSNSANMYVGGIAGGCNSISNCSVKNCKITTTAADIYNYPYVGGLVGYSEGSIEYSYADNNVLISEAHYYQASLMAGYSSSTVYVGGLAAYIKGSGQIKYCYAQNNTMIAYSTGDAYAGGLVGYLDRASVNQSYAKHNPIELQGYSKDANSLSSVLRRAGGLIGSANNSAITSCFAYNDSTLCEQNIGDLKYSTDSKIAGLIAGLDSISVTYCATYNLDIVSSTKDEFIPYALDNLNSCYVSSADFGNANNCELVDNAFWNSPDTVKSSLNLMGYYWQLNSGELPSLVF